MGSGTLVRVRQLPRSAPAEVVMRRAPVPPLVTGMAPGVAGPGWASRWVVGGEAGPGRRGKLGGVGGSRRETAGARAEGRAWGPGGAKRGGRDVRGVGAGAREAPRALWGVSVAAAAHKVSTRRTPAAITAK